MCLFSYNIGFAAFRQCLSILQQWHYIVHCLDVFHVKINGPRRLLEHLQWWSMGKLCWFLILWCRLWYRCGYIEWCKTVYCHTLWNLIFTMFKGLAKINLNTGKLKVMKMEIMQFNWKNVVALWHYFGKPFKRHVSKHNNNVIANTCIPC